MPYRMGRCRRRRVRFRRGTYRRRTFRGRRFRRRAYRGRRRSGNVIYITNRIVATQDFACDTTGASAVVRNAVTQAQFDSASKWRATFRQYRFCRIHVKWIWRHGLTPRIDGAITGQTFTGTGTAAGSGYISSTAAGATTTVDPMMVWCNLPANDVASSAIVSTAEDLLEAFPRARSCFIAKRNVLNLRVPMKLFLQDMVLAPDSGGALNFVDAMRHWKRPGWITMENGSPAPDSQQIPHGDLLVGIIGAPSTTYTLQRVITATIAYRYPYGQNNY